MSQIQLPVAQRQTSNRPESAFVPLVGESAVRLATVGLSPVRIDGLPLVQDADGTRFVRARRDRVGRLGEFRAFVFEKDGVALVSVAFVPRPSLDLGVYGAEIVVTEASAMASFGVYAGNGTWFAGQHAHHAWQDLRRGAPDLVPDEGQRSARARQRGFAFELEGSADDGPRFEALHRRGWAGYLQSLHDALELDVHGAEKNARSIEAWKAHRRTVAIAQRVLTQADEPDAARLYADVMAS